MKKLFLALSFLLSITTQSNRAIDLEQATKLGLGTAAGIISLATGAKFLYYNAIGAKKAYDWNTIPHTKKELEQEWEDITMPLCEKHALQVKSPKAFYAQLKPKIVGLLGACAYTGISAYWLLQKDKTLLEATKKIAGVSVAAVAIASGLLATGYQFKGITTLVEWCKAKCGMREKVPRGFYACHPIATDHPVDFYKANFDILMKTTIVALLSGITAYQLLK